MNEKQPFWKTKRFGEMSLSEWESLCDGCGLCCLNKLEDEDTAEVVFTSSACKYLDIGSCRCSDYANRQHNVPDCVGLTPGSLHRLPWLPETCGYRLVAEGRDLFRWHPLVSGDPESVHEAGISARNRVTPEGPAEDLEDFIIGWVRPGGPIPRPRPQRRYTGDHGED